MKPFLALMGDQEDVLSTLQLDIDRGLSIGRTQQGNILQGRKSGLYDIHVS